MAKFSWSMFSQLAQIIAPIIISIVNPKLTPLAGAIGNGIAEAEQIPSATSAQKLQHVLNITDQTAASINLVAGKTVVDPTNLHEAATEAIATTVAIINLAHPVATANAISATTPPTVK